MKIDDVELTLFSWDDIFHRPGIRLARRMLRAAAILASCASQRTTASKATPSSGRPSTRRRPMLAR